MGRVFFMSFGAAIGVTKNEGIIYYNEALDTPRTILNTQQPTKNVGKPTKRWIRMRNRRGAWGGGQNQSILG